MNWVSVSKVTCGETCELDWRTLEGEGETKLCIEGLGEGAYEEDGTLDGVVLNDIGVEYRHSGGVTLYRA